ncbi:hypothetical protein FXN81_12565 [Enterococcus faecium]|nr:hypothetical protein [Enterococcus faecium]
MMIQQPNEHRNYCNTSTKIINKKLLFKYSKRTVALSSQSFFGSIIYGTDESELILQPHFYFRY